MVELIVITTLYPASASVILLKLLLQKLPIRSFVQHKLDYFQILFKIWRRFVQLGAQSIQIAISQLKSMEFFINKINTWHVMLN